MENPSAISDNLNLIKYLSLNSEGIVWAYPIHDINDVFFSGILVTCKHAYTDSFFLIHKRGPKASDALLLRFAFYSPSAPFSHPCFILTSKMD